MLENMETCFLTNIIVRHFQIKPASLGFDLGRKAIPLFLLSSLKLRFNGVPERRENQIRFAGI